MKTISKIALATILLISFVSCKKEPLTNNFIANWIKNPISPGGNTYLKITDNSNFQIGYTVGPNYTKTAEGTYIYTSNQITFYYTPGPFNPCSNIPGNYQYKVVDSKFTLSLISDTCIDSIGTPRSTTIAGTWSQ